MNPVFYILISGALGVTGQVILKQAMLAAGPLQLAPDTLVGTLVALASNPLVVVGLGVTVSGTFFWLIALSRLDLSYAYPFASLNYILILVSSWWIFGEQPSAMRVFGVVAICVGVWAISRTAPRTNRGRRPDHGDGLVSARGEVKQ